MTGRSPPRQLRQPRRIGTAPGNWGGGRMLALVPCVSLSPPSLPLAPLPQVPHCGVAVSRKSSSRRSPRGSSPRRKQKTLLPYSSGAETSEPGYTTVEEVRQEIRRKARAQQRAQASVLEATVGWHWPNGGQPLPLTAYYLRVVASLTASAPPPRLSHCLCDMLVPLTGLVPQASVTTRCDLSAPNPLRSTHPCCTPAPNLLCFSQHTLLLGSASQIHSLHVP
jgi:hypothetical protein